MLETIRNSVCSSLIKVLVVEVLQGPYNIECYSTSCTTCADAENHLKVPGPREPSKGGLKALMLLVKPSGQFTFLVTV